MKHDVSDNIIKYIDGSPTNILCDPRDDIDQNLPKADQDHMDDPGTFVINPVRVQIRANTLIELIIIIILNFVNA